MRKILIAALFISITACSKRKTCYATTFDVGAQFAFKGFNIWELDTIVLRQYTGDGRFAQLKDVDTLISPAILLRNDTALRVDGTGFFPIREDRDYEVVLLRAMRIFLMSGVTTDHSPITYNSEDNGFCDQKTDRILSPYKVDINQVQTNTTFYNGSVCYVFLTK